MHRILISLFTVGLILSTNQGLTQVPPGYDQTLRETGADVYGALMVDSANNLYFSYDTSGDFYADSIYVSAPGSSTSMVFAEEFGNGAMIIQHSQYVFYVADNHINSLGDGDAVFRLEDLNQDGDCLDLGEKTFYTAAGSITNLADLALDANGWLYATDSVGMGTGSIYLIRDLNSDNDALDLGELTIFAPNPGTGFLGGVAIGPNQDGTIYVCETGGTVYWLVDLTADGDATDPDEMGVYAAGLGGGYDLEFDREGDLFVTSSDWNTGSDIVWECKPDGPDADQLADVVAVFADLSAEAGYITNVTFLNSQGAFEPYAANPATLYVCYLNEYYANMANVLAFTPTPVETPTTSTVGIIVLLLAGSWILRKRSSGRV